jgi:hypothetical protein
MTFQDEVAATLRQALQEKRNAEGVIVAFERDWQKLRESRVLPLLKEAAAAITAEMCPGRTGFVNGAVILSTNWENREHSLSFQPNAKDQTVTCHSSFDDEEDEAYDLDGLTEGVIKAKVQGLAYRIARGKKQDDGSVYERRGMFVV